MIQCHWHGIAGHVTWVGLNARTPDPIAGFLISDANGSDIEPMFCIRNACQLKEMDLIPDLDLK